MHVDFYNLIPPQSGITAHFLQVCYFFWKKMVKKTFKKFLGEIFYNAMTSNEEILLPNQKIPLIGYLKILCVKFY